MSTIERLAPLVFLAACGGPGGGQDTESPSSTGITGERLSDSPYLEDNSGLDAFGRDVALGDLDGDGTLDLVVSAGGVSSGYSGPPPETAVLLFEEPLATASNEATVRLDIGAPDRVVPLGDLDGDGTTDLLVQQMGGGAYVYGRALSTVLMEAPDLWGFGCGGDLTGDGVPDVVIAGYELSNYANAYVFDGTTRGVVDYGDAVALAVGERMDCRDVSGDGVADLVTGNAHDRVEVYLGPLSGTATEDGSWVGSPDDAVGFDVQVVTDVDGDGLDDMLATSLFAEDRASVVHLLSGPATSIGRPVTDATATVIGDPSMHFLGWSLDDAGDLDGDGYGDLVIASTGWHSEAAPVIVQFDGPLTGSVTVDRASRIWVGEVGELAGQGIAFGDIDGNGSTDMVLGAPEAGRVYQILDL